MAKKFQVVIDRERCKGCELCRSFCPKQIIGMDTQVNAKGYCPARMTDQSQCIGCQSCAGVSRRRDRDLRGGMSDG